MEHVAARQDKTSADAVRRAEGEGCQCRAGGRGGDDLACFGAADVAADKRDGAAGFLLGEEGEVGTELVDVVEEGAAGGGRGGHVDGCTYKKGYLLAYPTGRATTIRKEQTTYLLTRTPRGSH